MTIPKITQQTAEIGFRIALACSASATLVAMYLAARILAMK
jgi:hypothetical protein